ncbi:hypothetical protein H8959_016573 [Pygathrix nigripes]
MSSFDRFSEKMNNMGGDEDVDLPEVDGADDDSQDSDDEKMPDLDIYLDPDNVFHWKSFPHGPRQQLVISDSKNNLEYIR